MLCVVSSSRSKTPGFSGRTPDNVLKDGIVGEPSCTSALTSTSTSANSSATVARSPRSHTRGRLTDGGFGVFAPRTARSA